MNSNLLLKYPEPYGPGLSKRLQGPEYSKVSIFIIHLLIMVVMIADIIANTTNTRTHYC